MIGYTLGMLIFVTIALETKKAAIHIVAFSQF